MAYLLDLLTILSRSLACHVDILASVPLFLGSAGEGQPALVAER
jgi:hypothetical protein